LLFLSRVHPKKGIHLLLESLTGLERESLRDVRLVIVGSGERKYVRELADFVRRESSRLPRVEWMGEIWGDAKWAYFQGADLFVLPSHSENFGLAILEALQVGTPVLTTNQTPWELVCSLGAGRLVDATEEAIRTALAAFLEDRQWTMEQREALARAIHERFSWDRVGPAYLDFYENLLGRGE
jgi:glycosyltransferase involved in cell wall biosynthesis